MWAAHHLDTLSLLLMHHSSKLCLQELCSNNITSQPAIKVNPLHHSSKWQHLACMLHIQCQPSQQERPEKLKSQGLTQCNHHHISIWWRISRVSEHPSQTWIIIPVEIFLKEVQKPNTTHITKMIATQHLTTTKTIEMLTKVRLWLLKDA